MGLSAYSMILTAAGTEMRIEDVVIGDGVRDASSGGVCEVTKTLHGPGVGMHSIAAANGHMLHLTGDHPILTDRGLVRADDVKPGTMLQTLAGPSPCTESDALPGDFLVYDLQLGGSPSPTAFANTFIVAF